MLLHFSYGSTTQGDGARWDVGDLKTWKDEQGLAQLSSGSACFLPVRLQARGSQPREDHVNFQSQKKMKEEKISETSNSLLSFCLSVDGSAVRQAVMPIFWSSLRREH